MRRGVHETYIATTHSQQQRHHTSDGRKNIQTHQSDSDRDGDDDDNDDDDDDDDDDYHNNSKTATIKQRNGNKNIAT